MPSFFHATNMQLNATMQRNLFNKLRSLKRWYNKYKIVFNEK